MLRRKAMLIVVVLSSLILGLVGAVSADEPVTLTWWAQHSVDVDDIVSRFEALHPNIKIDAVVSAGGWDDVWQKLMVSVAGGVGPDIVRGKEFWVAELASRGALLPLTDYMARDGQEFLAEATLKRKMDAANTYQGELYGVPSHGNVHHLFYNPVLFEEAGLTGPPDDFDELRDYSMKLTRPEKNQWGSMLYTYTRLEPALVQWSFEQFVRQNEGRFLEIDDEGNPTYYLNDPEAIEALEYWIDNIYEYQCTVPPEKWVNQMELHNSVGMWWGGQWANATYPRDFPDLNWAPALNPSYKNRGVLWEGTSEWVMKYTKHPDEAWEFLKFLLSEEIDLVWNTEHGTVPWRDATWNKPPFNEMPGYAIAQQHFNEYPVRYLEYYVGYQEVCATIAEEVQMAFYGLRSAEDALNSAQTRATELIKEIRSGR